MLLTKVRQTTTSRTTQLVSEAAAAAVGADVACLGVDTVAAAGVGDMSQPARQVSVVRSQDQDHTG